VGFVTTNMERTTLNGYLFVISSIQPPVHRLQGGFVSDVDHAQSASLFNLSVTLNEVALPVRATQDHEICRSDKDRSLHGYLENL
jgi:hypothetical protein